MFDGATDAAVLEVEMIYCRVIGQDGLPVNYYLGLADVEHAHAEGVYTAIDNTFRSLGINDWKDRVIGAGCDGASVNVGNSYSIAMRVRDQDHLYVLIVYFTAYHLELEVLAAIKENNNLTTVQDLLHKLYKHYHYSPKALRELRAIAEAMEEKLIKPVRLQGTRWMPHLEKALEVLLKGYTVIQNHFDHVAGGNQGTAEVKGRAVFVNKKLKDFRVLRFMHFMLYLLRDVKLLSLEFQQDNITASGVLDALDAIMH